MSFSTMHNDHLDPDRHLYNDEIPDDLGNIFAGLGGCDGAHRGVGDWYDPERKALAAALEIGADFDTGWYSVKHEIHSARIKATGNHITCEASVSDDFDTTGRGVVTLERDISEPETARVTLDKVSEALYQACDDALSDKRDNEDYAGFSVHHDTPWHKDVYSGWRWWIYRITLRHWRGILRVNTTWKNAWVETLLLPRDGDDTSPPTGDNYHEWYWQGECESIPQPVKDSFLKWAHGTIYAEHSDDSLSIDGWMIKQWSNE